MWIEWLKNSYKYIFDLHFSAIEKESKGSNIVQIRLSNKQKGELQKKADEVGLPLTQYIIFLITKDLKDL
ncbi:TPA: hypothetical protein R4L52_000287 [Campylobacter jejuni]|uniref:Uncharacterized protein n=2 Tax=Campylobacter novaezeelandiae TaxID=2267891 RepID=A0A4Q9JTU3_9BACT|nr:hypothetical protein [Campylobacter jejuni]EAI8665094.1 hypothetical protein [Campylobacter coli]TBR79849.1 hypothetical protein DU473_06745 [Campylobacter novaezeelandiae]EAI3992358.1 hypothetical protein [Campylobacter jejuni]EAI4336563.1 hypothetical protein [Campylobacter jejuni]